MSEQNTESSAVIIPEKNTDKLKPLNLKQVSSNFSSSKQGPSPHRLKPRISVDAFPCSLGTRSPSARSPCARSPSARSPMARSPSARSPKVRIPIVPSHLAHSPSARSPFARSPSARSPGARSPGARSPGARSPSGRSLGGRSPSGRSSGGHSPRSPRARGSFSSYSTNAKARKVVEDEFCCCTTGECKIVLKWIAYLFIIFIVCILGYTGYKVLTEERINSYF